MEHLKLGAQEDAGGDAVSTLATIYCLSSSSSTDIQPQSQPDSEFQVF